MRTTRLPALAPSVTLVVALGLALTLIGCSSHPPATAAANAVSAAPDYSQLDIAQLQQRMADGSLSAHQLTQWYLDRIAALDKSGPQLNAVLTINPDALTLADALDAERKAGKLRGPLHGIPVLLKDNIDTGDQQPTTAGSLALAGKPAPRDAHITQRLREAGAVILGKTNLSEWANYRSTRSSSGWSGAGGQTRNPHVLDRSPCGSSSGSGAAIAASLAAVAVGTETDGSVVCPASQNGIVGFKPTLGLVSRTGIVPLAHSQDTAGPMARSVADAALLLDVLAGDDAADSITTSAAAHAAQHSGFAAALQHASLKGVRLGVVRSIGGQDDRGRALLDAVVATLRAQGAEVIDPVALPHDGDYGKDELRVLTWEFRHDLDSYLAARAHPGAGSLAEVVAFNQSHADRELQWFGQEFMLEAQALKPAQQAAYLASLARSKQLAGRDGIDAALQRHHLDALVSLTQNPAWVIDLVDGDNGSNAFASSTSAAVAGYPHATVPAGFVHGLPMGVSFIGTAWQDAKILALAQAFEQAQQARRAPALLPTVKTD